MINIHTNELRILIYVLFAQQTLTNIPINIYFLQLVIIELFKKPFTLLLFISVPQKHIVLNLINILYIQSKIDKKLQSAHIPGLDSPQYLDKLNQLLPIDLWLPIDKQQFLLHDSKLHFGLYFLYQAVKQLNITVTFASQPLALFRKLFVFLNVNSIQLLL